MTQPNLQLLMQQYAAILTQAGLPLSRLEVRLLLQWAMGISHEALVAHGDAPLTETAYQKFLAGIERRLAGEPLAYIRGTQEFWSLPFIVTRDTLIPRADSEALIEAVIRHRPAQDTAYNILDLGTGSGCLLLTLLHEYPNATGVAVDISEAAICIAKQNAMQLSLAKRVVFQVNSWTEGMDGSFDIIVTNPPYVPDSTMASLQREVAHYQPRRALVGGEDGADAYRELALCIPERLAKGGLLVLEIGEHQQELVTSIMMDAGLKFVDVGWDLEHRARALVFVS
jgi:release factor glutamine methyltransferase